MKLTLRKAAALASSLLETAAKYSSPHDQHIISVYTPSDDLSANIKESREQLLSEMALSTSLTNAAFGIRRLLAHANVHAGVSDLLCEKEALNAEERLLSALNPRADHPVINLFEVASKIDTLRERSKTGTGRMEDSVIVRLLDRDNAKVMLDRLAVIRQRKTAIADELLALNMSNSITVPADIAALLKEQKLV